MQKVERFRFPNSGSLRQLSQLQKKLPLLPCLALVEEVTVPSLVQVMFPLLVQEIPLLLEQVMSPFEAQVMQISQLVRLQEVARFLSLALEKLLLTEQVTVAWHQMPLPHRHP